MRVYLINLPYTVPQFEGRENGIFEQYEQNYELAYIASYLDFKNVENEVIECTPLNYNIKKLADYINSQSFDAIVLAVEEYTYLNAVRFLNKLTIDTYIVFAGKYSAINYENILKVYPKKSFCLIANKEIACFGIIEYIDNKIELSNLNNIAYFTDSVIKKELSNSIDFDMLPLPKISYVSENGMGSIETTRGCNNSCIYCTVNANRKNINSSIEYKSVEKIIEEMSVLIDSKKVKYIRFLDDNFLISSVENKKRIHNLCESIKSKGWKIKFKIFARAVDIINNKELLSELIEVGLSIVFVGIESFIQRQLDFYKKSTTVEQNIESLKILKELNIKYILGFLPLDPYVSLYELEENLNILKKIKYSEVKLYSNLPISCIPPLSVINGSDFEKHINDNNLVENNELGYSFINTEISKFYQIKKQWVSEIMPIHNKYYYIYIAEQKNEYALSEKLKIAKENLIEIDIDFMINIVNNISKSDNDVFIDNIFYRKINNIKKIFSDAEKELNII